MTVKIELVGEGWDDIMDPVFYAGAVVDAAPDDDRDDWYVTGGWEAYTGPDPEFGSYKYRWRAKVLDTEENPVIPSHYFRGGYELNDVLEAWDLHKDAYKNQAVCYIMRSAFKGSEVQDIEKAVRYLQRWLKSNGGAE